MSALALHTLKTYFGFSTFRPGQQAIVEAIVDKQQVLAILPTGGGKSLCFQVPALMFSGTTLVISPLLSLMKDQVDHLHAAGISADYLGSNLSAAEIRLRLAQLKAGAYKLFYVAPERLGNPSFIQACLEIEIPLVVIDEAHCISMWGKQFRPSYQKIPQFIEKIQTHNKKIAVAAFTATATKQVKEEIMRYLHLEKPRLFEQGFLRENLFFHNLICDSVWMKNTYLFKLLADHVGETIIIYCATRIACEKVAKLICFYDFKKRYCVGIYHGGLDSSAREQVQNDFLADRINIIVATNAFGMGVDKSTVRLVIHYQLPSNLENYAQESGRAGRDQKPAHAYLLYHEQDVLVQQGMIARQFDDYDNPRCQIELDKLRTMQAYALSKQCLQGTMSNYFAPGKNRGKRCKNCYLCLEKTLNLSESQQAFFNHLENINHTYVEQAQHDQLPIVFTIRQMELMAIVQPHSREELQKIPGVGNGILSFYANHRISGEVSRNC